MGMGGNLGGVWGVVPEAWVMGVIFVPSLWISYFYSSEYYTATGASAPVVRGDFVAAREPSPLFLLDVKSEEEETGG